MTKRPVSYRLLQAWARAAVSVFYRRVEVEGHEHVVAGRPTILAANHSNALADVAVIVAKVPEFPHFLAAASWWKRRSARMLFSLGGVLPVRRRGDDPGPQDNVRTFDACFRALADHAHLAIFPEGVMNLDPTLRPLKTGAARIGLGAAESGVDGVVIVAVGLVYKDRGRFRSDATLRFGQPIVMDDWRDRYTDDAFGTVSSVTQQLTEELTLVTKPDPTRHGHHAPERTRLTRELLILTPPAAFGMIANAPVLVAGLLARVRDDEMWQASIKGVSGTALLPLTWGTQLALFSRRYGVRRAFVVTAAGAASGRATLAWLDRRRDLAAPSAAKGD